MPDRLSIGSPIRVAIQEEIKFIIKGSL
jgi:hypothetical protein